MKKPLEKLHLVSFHSQERLRRGGAPGTGDIVMTNTDLYDATGKTKLAKDHGVCVRINFPNDYACFWTVLLPDGQISVQGPATRGGDTMLSIVGGTGKYVGASGQVRAKARDIEGTAYDYYYEFRCADDN